ncbi:MAG: DnaD domain protein [Lachnospiraceae bacterium]
MENITLHCNETPSATCISNIFMDEYMPAANGEFVKVYLYLLRCMNSNTDSCSVSAIADRFDHTEKDIVRALSFWEKMKLIKLEYNEQKHLCGIQLLEIVSQKSNSPTPSGTVTFPPGDAAVVPIPKAASVIETMPVDPSPKKQVLNPILKPEYSQDDIKNFSQKEDVQELIFITEHYLKRTLNSTDINTILFWYDSLHFSADLIEYLIEYCVTRNHTSLRYMDKIAMSWADVDIRSVEQAKKNATLHSQANYGVMKALGIKGRNLVELETSMIDKWTQEYGFTLDIITEACGRTITAIHQPSFEYTDRILNNWHKSSVKHLEDVAKLDQSYQKNKTANSQKKRTSTDNKFTNFSQRSYNYEQLEKQLLNRPKNQEVQ